MADTRIKLGLSDELLAQVDQRRGDVPRERWLRRLVEAELAGPPPIDDHVDLLERGRVLASQRDALIAQGVPPAELNVPIAPVTSSVPQNPQPVTPKKKPDAAPKPQTPPPPPKPIVQTKAEIFDSPDRSARGDGGWSTKVVRTPRAGHEWVGVKPTCMRMDCEYPKDKAAHS